jgi:hypothetical protein
VPLSSLWISCASQDLGVNQHVDKSFIKTTTYTGCLGLTLAVVPPMFSHTAAANASARGQRAAILASPLSELSGFCLVVDCLAPGCGGERTFAVSDLAGFYGAGRTVGDVLRRMRCSGGCGGRAGAAWLVTGPVLSTRVRPRRVPLVGAEARE